MSGRAAILFSAILSATSSNAQPASQAGADAIAAAVKSPQALARFLESNRTVDWKFLRKSLGLPESEYWFPPCPTAEAACTTELSEVLNPDQVILIVRGGPLSLTTEYLRFLKGDSRGAWRFAGEYNAFKKDGPSNHDLIRLGDKLVLKITSNRSEFGAGISQEQEDWFDLTLPDFEPVFTLTIDGGENRFALGVGRNFHAEPIVVPARGVERINVVLSMRFVGQGLDFPVSYTGVYERTPGERKFALRSAYADHQQLTPMSTEDFADLADPFSGISDATLVRYALPGLQKIASSSDSGAKDWLRMVLDNTGDTGEKRSLLELLRKH